MNQVILSKKKLSVNAKLIYTGLTCHAGNRDSCRVGQGTLATELGIHRVTVNEGIQELQKEGIISIDKSEAGSLTYHFSGVVNTDSGVVSDYSGVVEDYTDTIYIKKEVRSNNKSTHKPKKEKSLVKNPAEAEKRFAARESKFRDEVMEHSQYNKLMLDAFANYWTERNNTKGKMKIELQQTWETTKRLVTWKNNDKTYGKKLDGMIPPSDFSKYNKS